MRTYLKSALALATLALLMGCSTSKEPKIQKPAPERPVIVVFKDMSTVQVKNNLMGACSKDRLFIQPDRDEVTCIRHKFNIDREQILLDTINDEFARRITDNIRFSITPEGRDVRVVGNAYVEYLSPLSVSIEGSIVTKRANLLDNNSFSLVEMLLKQAGGTLP